MMDFMADAVSVANLEKRFGNFVAVNKITFSVKKGEILENPRYRPRLFTLSAPEMPKMSIKKSRFSPTVRS